MVASFFGLFFRRILFPLLSLLTRGGVARQLAFLFSLSDHAASGAAKNLENYKTLWSMITQPLWQLLKAQMKLSRAILIQLLESSVCHRNLDCVLKRKSGWRPAHHSTLCSPLCTCLRSAALALLCLMMIMTLWTQSGCRRRHFKRFYIIIFLHFWRNKIVHSKSS